MGDGFTTVIHCENYEDSWDKEPDAGPFYCRMVGKHEEESE